jgi:arylsulfatase A-like enzyme
MPTSRGLTRRDFLKLISFTPVGIFSRPLSNVIPKADVNRPNIIILVFDAWSQHHVSLYGYPRLTMPNLDRFAANATVYHNHYTAGTFTTVGTSSLLTGLHPWSHRALQLGATVTPQHAAHNIFSVLSGTHATLGYAQNEYADQVIYGLDADLDHHIENSAFSAQDSNFYSAPAFDRKNPIAFASIEDNLLRREKGNDSSMFLGPLLRLYFLRQRLKFTRQHKANYPRGLPNSSELFTLDDVVDGAIETLKTIQQPTLAYFHFYPPHDPYCPTTDFFETFKDGWRPTNKPIHDLSESKLAFRKLASERQYYDEFIASWDQEAGRLFDFLQESGLTQNSYIFVTADHGELFERGITGHFTKLLYDPLIHVPLIVSAPGQLARKDVHSHTSSVDLMPTIASLAGKSVEPWMEGQLLPQLGGQEDEHRSLFSMDAKMNSSFGPLRNFSVSLTRDQHRLVWYSYPKDKYEKFEFFDLDADYDELNDLFPSASALARTMQDELMQKIADANRSFPGNGL